MINKNWSALNGRFIFLITGIAFLSLCIAGSAGAQSSRAIPAGTTINVRTTESIDAMDSDGQVFRGTVDHDVRNGEGILVIPKGSSVELIIRRASENEFALDLDFIDIHGDRYGVAATDVGKIAAIGAGGQGILRGERIAVPAESVLTFRLTQPLRAGVSDEGYLRHGIHYHQGYYNAAFESGLRAGRQDAEYSRRQDARADEFVDRQDRDEYVAGYNTGYESFNNSEYSRQKPGVPGSPWSISIERNGNVNWQTPGRATIYVQMDDQPAKLFAGGQSGTVAAPWMQAGHHYIFILRDENGNEVARTEQDLR
jgi:hypothetical protein